MNRIPKRRLSSGLSLLAVVSLAAVGCGGAQLNQARVTEVQSSVTAAEAVGANDQPKAALHLQLARGSLAHPIMNIGTTPEETLKIWTSKFPMLYGFNRVDRAKPGATVLALNPLYNTVYGPGILLAVQEIGKGRSMAFTSDTTRTWGRDFETLWGEPIRPGAILSERNCDGRYYQQFWVNAIRWLAQGKAGRTNNPVVLELAE